MVLSSILFKLFSLVDIWHDQYALTLISLGSGFAFGIMGLIVGVWGAVYQVRKQRVYRELAYTVVSNGPLVGGEKFPGRVKIFLDGQIDKNMQLIILEVKNTGTTSVKKDDYFESLHFEFDKEVVAASVTDTIPPRLISPSLLDNFPIVMFKAIELPDFSLNPDDMIRLSVFLKGKSSVRHRGRIDQGKVKEFFPQASELRNYHRRLILYGLGFLISLILLATLVLAAANL
jgi:hypothetical protein